MANERARRPTLTLRTPRLALTPLGLTDVDILTALFTDPAVVEFAGHLMPAEQISLRMPAWTRRGANGCLGIWCVSACGSGEKIGTGALLPMPTEEDETDFGLLVPDRIPDTDVEIGFFLKPSAWGRGYATEVCRRLVQFAFETSPLTGIVATHDPENTASRHVLLKSGFVDRGWRLCYGEQSPFLAITRSEWLESPPAQ